MGELISSLRGKCDFESDGSMYSSYVSFLFFFFWMDYNEINKDTCTLDESRSF